MLIEHDMSLIMSNWAYLRTKYGQTIAQHADEIKNDKRVIEAHLGGWANVHAQVENLSVHYGISSGCPWCQLWSQRRRGSFHIGANGAGKTTILRTISGLVRPSAEG